MISPAHVQTMARYNGWQNRSLVQAADSLGAAARLEDRGAFWGGIQTTLVHVLWADLIWMSRFDGWDRPQVTIGESPDLVTDWDTFCDMRAMADRDIAAWADRLQDSDLAGDLTWHSGASGRDVTRPRWLLVTHMFNHQTHHRGQVHAILTAAGALTEDTDLFLMPADPAG
ncbi:DinB family protein [Anianabacter salinae]|uniref:DinB family protein n=1 Tax=Anianabacter salinae TaxID=2851023 RepID=UPI00225E5DFA|nr:DinB family protein [Anianabacter salinae]MBV0912266.1 damage-inducible protein DinB [Anianabacter salinae]